jgi:hypothetical protein
VYVLPADILSNGRLSEPGNADFLETLRGELPGRWTFDEFHHGLQAPSAEASVRQSAFTLLVAQLAFTYLLVILAVVRRFGPAWSEPITATGSAASYLVGLGAVHHRLGHHREAASRLLDRARELDGRLSVPEQEVDSAPGFLALAQQVGRLQSPKEGG